MTLTARNLYQAAANARNERWLATKRANYPFEVVLSKTPPRPIDPEIKEMCKGHRVFARTFKGYHWLFQNVHDHTAFIERYGDIVVSSNYSPTGRVALDIETQFETYGRFGIDLARAEERTIAYLIDHSNLNKTIIFDSLTEASEAMAKMSRKKIAKEMKANPVRAKKPKKLPPGKYSGCVVDYDTVAGNSTFEIVRRTPYSDRMITGISSNDLQATGSAPLKTKADMMRRIFYLETRIEQNNKRHDKALDALRLEVSKDVSTIYRKFAEGLLEAHISGLKEGSLLRRS